MQWSEGTAAVPVRWSGIVPPLLTPLLGFDELDPAGLERLIEHVVAGGVHGIFLLGTTGEAPGLSGRLRREVIERGCHHIAGRVPVMVGITDSAFAESVSLAHFAADAGAAALILAAPFYYPANQEEMQSYLQHLARELPLPCLLYNIPSHTKIAFDPETVRRAMDIPQIVGLKDTSGSMNYFHQLVRLLPRRPDWTLLMGTEQLLAESVLLGGTGGVPGGANLCPELYVDLYRAASTGDLAQVSLLHRRVIELTSRIYQVGPLHSAYLRGLKCAVSCVGLCDDFMAEPFRKLPPEQRNQIEGYLVEMGIEPYRKQ